MANLQKIGRVVYRHEWTSLAEWVGALDELADMTDDQIARLVRQQDRREGGRRLQ